MLHYKWTISRLLYGSCSYESRIKDKGLTAFIVEREWEGVSIGKIEDKCGIRCAQVSEVIFDNVRVPKENMLGEEGKGFAVAMKDLDGGRIGVAAQGLGIAKGAYDIAFNYLKRENSSENHYTRISI